MADGPHKPLELFLPSGSPLLSLVGNDEEVAFAGVVHPPCLDQPAQGLVHQLEEVLGGGDLSEISLDALQDVLHVRCLLSSLQACQDCTDGVG